MVSLSTLVELLFGFLDMTREFDWTTMKRFVYAIEALPPASHARPRPCYRPEVGSLVKPKRPKKQPKFETHDLKFFVK
jgi:hypothetical protein